MAALAKAGNTHHAVALGRYRYVFRIMQRRNIRPHQRGGTVRHHVARHTARKIQKGALQRRADQPSAVAALFTVAYGELGVRRYAECGLRVVRKIIVYIAHPGFFVRAQQNAQRVGQRLSALFKKFGHV